MNIDGNALVIGGGSGIGRAVAILLAREGASGIIVADLDLNAAQKTIDECCQAVATTNNSEQFQTEKERATERFQEKEKAGKAQFRGEGKAKERFRALFVDVTKEDSVVGVFEEAVRIFDGGRVDYCVNSAGIGAQSSSDIATLPLSEFQHFLNVNTTSMFLVTKQASITMRAQTPLPISPGNPNRGTTRGVIVNLASALSLVASAGVLGYTTSKHAVLGLVKSSALDNAPHKIRVNAVCPSWTDTPMVQRATAGVAGLTDYINAAVPMGRIAVPEEVADVVAFLCSGRSSYMTGTAVVVDGGTTLTAMRSS